MKHPRPPIHALLAWAILAALMICSPAAPAAAQGKATVLSPQVVQWLSPGDMYWASIKGGSGGTAAFHIGGGTEVPMAETKPGIYTGLYRVSPQDHGADAGVTITFTPPGDAAVTLSPKGAVTFLTAAEPMVALITEDQAVFRAGPSEDHDRLTPLAKGIRLVVTGRFGNYYRLALGQHASGWLIADELTLAPKGTWPSRPLILNMKTEAQGRSSRLLIDLSEPGAYGISETVSPPSVTITFYDAVLHVGTIVYDNQDPVIKQVTTRQNAPDIASVTILLKGSQVWGVRPSYHGNQLVVDLPGFRSQGAKPLQGATIVLDPGHGGEESGAVGVGGLAEKNANLWTARTLAPMLQKAGATVVFTRDGDTRVAPPGSTLKEDLRARVERALALNGTIFVSIHHNAAASVKESRAATGTEVYYYIPQSYALAAAIAPHLAAAIRQPRYKVFWRSFHVIRQWAMPAVLVEVAYISNPREEAKINTKAYRTKAAKGIYQGLVDYFRGAGSGAGE